MTRWTTSPRSPAHPNSDGLLQSDANAIGPGKRPLSSMTPTIVMHEGKTVLVLGSPGSSKIITTVANVLMGVIDYRHEHSGSGECPPLS